MVTRGFFRQLCKMAGWCGVASAVVSCTGPISDNVAGEFRKQWLAKNCGPGKCGPIEGVSTREKRNQFVDEFMMIKDLQFRNYVTALRRGSSYGELTADGARLVLDGVASVTGTAPVKAGLAAASAGITGFTGAIRKDVLFDQALPSFVDKMVELRANKHADIIRKKSLELADYTAAEAFADVEEYGGLGSFDAALRAITIDTAESTGHAKAELAAAKGDVATLNAAVTHTQTGMLASRAVSPGASTLGAIVDPAGKFTLTRTKPSGGGAPAAAPDPVIPDAFKVRNHELETAFPKDEVAAGVALSKIGLFAKPSGNQEQLAKLVLAKASLPLLPRMTGVAALTYYRKHAIDDASLTKLKTAYQACELIP